MATIKQQRAVAKMAENGGNVSKAMRDVGYSKVTATKPEKLTTSKGFKELAEKFLPDNLLLKVHKEGLQATKVISAVVTSKDANEKTNDFIEVPDHAVRHKYLETGYKIREKLKDGDDKPPSINFVAIKNEYK